MYWRPVDPNTPLEALVGRHFLAIRGSRGALLELERDDDLRHGPIVVTLTPLDHPLRCTQLQFGPRRAIGQVARSWRRRARVLTSAPFTIELFPPRTPPPWILRQLRRLVPRWFRPKAWDPYLPPRITFRSFGDEEITGANVVRYARHRERERAEGAVAGPAEGRTLRARARIEAVREAYGAARLDIVRRIDEPALFDGDCPTTARLLALLWEAEHLGSPELAALEAFAVELEVAHEVAVSHALRRGIGHLPKAQRARARQASKAARLAVDGATEGERDAALARLRDILDALALYYLPSGDECTTILRGHAAIERSDQEA